MIGGTPMIHNVQGTSLMKEAGVLSQQQIAKTSDTLFTEAFDSAKELLQATAQAEKVSSQLTTDFITGKNENIHNLMIASEKASVLLQFTMQVRNQVLDAYREIMRMPV